MWVYKNIKTNNYIRIKFNFNDKTNEINETTEEISDINKADIFIKYTHWSDKYWSDNKNVIKVSYEQELRKLKLNRINNG